MAYLPKRGDAIWIDLDPRIGREQSGHRPALVLSPERYNRKMKVAICCPITSRARRSAFELTLPGTLAVSGVVLVYQVRTVDWRERGARFMARVPEEVVEDALSVLASILKIPQLH